MSTGAVDNAFAPALVAPAGAPSVADSVMPAGMFVLMDAVILAVACLVEPPHVAPFAAAEVGPDPATAVLISSVGVPVTAIWLIASTWNETAWVAVDCAFDDAAAAT